MKRILIFIAVLLTGFSAVGSNDSTKMHVRIEVQLRPGYYSSWCVNSPQKDFPVYLDQLSGVQLSPGAGISLDWKWFSLGLTVSMLARINLNQSDQSTVGLGVMGNFDLATWNSSVPLGFRIFGGILPLGFVPT